MSHEKHEGYANVYKAAGCYELGVIHPIKEDAIIKKRDVGYVSTVKIEWEE